MIKVGDRVYVWNKMSMTGEVIELRAIPTKTWFVGGSAGTSTVAKVNFDNGEIKEILVSELMRLE